MNNTASLSTEDLIGQSIQKLVEVESGITRLEFMNSGINQPEIIAAHHEELRELRQQRANIRKQLAELKLQHKRELLNRLSAINEEIDHGNYGVHDLAGLKQHSRELENRIVQLQGEIEFYES